MSNTIKPTKALKGLPQDNVAVILSAAKAGETIQIDCHGAVETLNCVSDIPAFHKVATTDIAQGDTIVRLATPIGVATKAITKGELVHVHNIRSRRAQTGTTQKLAVL